MELELFKYLMEHTSDAIYFKDHASRFITASRMMARQFGVADPKNMVGKTDFDFFTEVHARQAFEDEQEIIHTGKALIGKEELETWPDGHESWVLSEKIPLRDEDGKIVGIFGVSKDITKQKLAERAQQISEAQLREHLREVEQNLLRAQTIQQAMLPMNHQPHPRVRCEYYYRPVATVSGDILSLMTGRRNGVGVFVGDLAGHGLSAALFMTLVYFLSGRLFAIHAKDPERILTQMNDELQSLMKNSFMTALYGYIEFAEAQREARLICASAAHPYPIHYRAADNSASMIPLKSSACIGILPELTCKQAIVPLETGDRLFFLTDGLTETADADGVLLGEERLIEMVQQSAKLDLKSNLDAVIEAAGAYHDQKQFIDDTTLLAVEIL